MAEDLRGRGYAPRDSRDMHVYPPPPLRPEEDDRSNGNGVRVYAPPPMRPDDDDRHNGNGNGVRPLPPSPGTGGGVVLPSIHDFSANANRPGPPPPLEPRSRGSYSVSPTEPGSYPPSGPQIYQLPPVHSVVDPRGPPPPQPADPRQAPMAYRQPEPNQYYSGPGPQRTPPHHYHREQYQPYAYGPAPGHPVMATYDYRGAPNGAQQQPPSAPRQRTSIACRYCRKRKIRCSGYANTPDGKCVNCKKTGNDCVFQPVSSSASTAFVPISAIPGGVPHGTTLYGAFGQPLHTGAMMSDQTPPQGMPLPSPTGSFYDDRAEAGRRRQRDDEHERRLPPPHPSRAEEEHRRRSPASSHSNTPPSAYHHYDPHAHSSTPPMTMAYPPVPPPRRDSPLGHQPPTSGAAAGGQNAPNNSSSIMSLGHLMDHAPRSMENRDDVDRHMLGRLNKRR